MTTPDNHGSPTLADMFKNCITEEQVQQASVENLRGPYHVGGVTAFVFRPTVENDQTMAMSVLSDKGLASGEGGSMEIDMNQLDADDLRERAQNWYREQMRQGMFGRHQKVAVVYDDTRTVATELRSAAAQKELISRLEEMSRPPLTQRVVNALKQAFRPS